MKVQDIEFIISKTLKLNRVKLQKNFNFGVYKNVPNTQGIFSKKGQWYIYSVDEKLVNTISGPFSDSDVIYACALLMHCSRYFNDYNFSKHAINTFIHVHYRSIEEIH